MQPKFISYVNINIQCRSEGGSAPITEEYSVTSLYHPGVLDFPKQVAKVFKQVLGHQDRRRKCWWITLKIKFTCDGNFLPKTTWPELLSRLPLSS